MTQTTTDKEFMALFEGRAFTREQWTHEAHVRAAWLCLATCKNYQAARAKLRRGVREMTYRWGCFSGAGPSYHETITSGYLRVISGRSQDGETFAKFHARNPDLFTGDRLEPLRPHYTLDLLRTDAAREKFVPPDLAPLPVRARRPADVIPAQERLAAAAS